MRTLDPARGQQILDSAAQLFARGHYHEVRMEDIAAQAGVAKGTLYRYFQHKEDLYLALTVSGLQRLFEESQQRTAGPGTPEARLESFIAGIICFYKRYPYFLDLWASIDGSRSAAAVAAVKMIREQYHRLLTNLIREIDGAGRFRSCHPDLAALSLMGMIRTLLRTLPQPWPPHLPAWIYQQFLHGMHK